MWQLATDLKHAKGPDRESLSLLFTLTWTFCSKHNMKSGKTTKRELELFQMKKTGHVPGMVALHLLSPQCFRTESAEQNHSEATQAKARQKTNFSTGCRISSLHAYRGDCQEDTTFLG